MILVGVPLHYGYGTNWKMMERLLAKMEMHQAQADAMAEEDATA
jgi:hypothetical protein